MIALKKAMIIFKYRWPEVVMLVGLQVILSIAMQLTSQLDHQSSPALAFFFSLVVLASAVVFLMLQLGFFRTAHTSSRQARSPTELLKTGKPFFWRMFAFGFLLALGYVALTRFFYEMLLWSTGTEEAWFDAFALGLTTLLLMKFLLFIPAIIVVRNCRLFDALRKLRTYSVTQIKPIVGLYMLNLALGLINSLLFGRTEAVEPGLLSPQILFNTFMFLVALLFITATVKFVGSEDFE